MKILFAPASPYSAKVRMAARYCGLEAQSVPVDTNADPDELVDANPLGKIPTLIDDGMTVYDSRAIMQYLDRKSGKLLYPRNAQKRTEAEVLEALCDGITDCLLAMVYENRFRPLEKVHQPWLDRQWSKIERSLDYLNDNLPRTTKKLHGGHFALAGLIGYLALRFDGQWERGRPKLKNWPGKFAKFFPEYDDYKSKG
ncbi:glutathione S-transferase family protein [Hoeflea poritis]|uniref:Glutathione S-transferase n=1 Tax=Hoeflea poritis TaxID=2993659 RepID=A0ABT4VQK1_9HYPH|nr:glutathione S-transferase [Hoeflea poritis]MDA4846987.1 glutathione S-transferase [Hoeflea poritis]